MKRLELCFLFVNRTCLLQVNDKINRRQHLPTENGRITSCKSHLDLLAGKREGGNGLYLFLSSCKRSRRTRCKLSHTHTVPILCFNCSSRRIMEIFVDLANTSSGCGTFTLSCEVTIKVPQMFTVDDNVVTVRARGCCLSSLLQWTDLWMQKYPTARKK